MTESKNPRSLLAGESVILFRISRFCRNIARSSNAFRERQGRMKRILIPLKKRPTHPNDKVEAELPAGCFHSPIKVRTPVGGEAVHAIIYEQRSHDHPLHVSRSARASRPSRSLLLRLERRISARNIQHVRGGYGVSCMERKSQSNVGFLE